MKITSFMIKKNSNNFVYILVKWFYSVKCTVYAMLNMSCHVWTRARRKKTKKKNELHQWEKFSSSQNEKKVISGN